MKKILSVMLLAAVIIFTSNNSAEAKMIYMGDYDDGTKAYLWEEMVSLKRESAFSPYYFQLIVMIDNNTRNGIMYEFRYNGGRWKYMKLRKGKISGGESVHGSVEWNIENYLITTDLFKKNFK